MKRNISVQLLEVTESYRKQIGVRPCLDFETLIYRHLEWRRSVRVSQVKPSNCFRRLEKLLLPSIFDISLSSFMMWNLQSCPTTVLNERMRHFRGRGLRHTLTPPTYFQRSGFRNPFKIDAPGQPHCSLCLDYCNSLCIMFFVWVLFRFLFRAID